MQDRDQVTHYQATSAGDLPLSDNSLKVLRQTYMLLGVTLLFSSIMAGISMAVNPPMFTGMVCSIAALVALFTIHKFQNSITGIYMVFGVAGLLGFGLGPLLNHYLAIQGSEPVIMALGTTAVVFFGMSGYVLTTKKELSGMTNFLMTGLMVAFVAGIASVVLSLFGVHLSGLALAVSAMFAFLSSLMIAWETSRIIHGGETSYIMATVSLFVSIYNLFTSLLHLLGFAGED